MKDSQLIRTHTHVCTKYIKESNERFSTRYIGVYLGR